MAKDNEISRLVRITNVITMLKSKRVLKASEIADKFGVSVRTIYRDIKVIENAGIPILTVDGKGYSLMDGYTLPPLTFSESEANALITAGHLIQQSKDTSLITQFENAITKIKAVFRYGIKEKTELLSAKMVVVRNTKQTQTSHSLSEFQLAITGKILTTITYQKPNDEQPISRNIEPVAICYSNENWILIAWCRLRNDYRAFRIDRMKKIEFLTTTFKERKFDIRKYFGENTENLFLYP